MENNVECPYCNHEFYYEGEDISQDETVHIECENEVCEKMFTAQAVYSLDYLNIDKAPCLNGGKHVLKESIGVPEWAPKQYRCQSCDCHGTIERFKNHTITQR